MKNTSLCYIFKGRDVLLLHKTREGDGNFDKWLGVGGKFLENETPLECAMRETKEETGLTLINPHYRARITFISDCWESEIMHLFTCDETEGELTACDEGELLYVPKDKILSLPHWEGDKIFLELILRGDEPFFELTLEYEGEALKNY